MRDIELLIIDLCGRLPYETTVQLSSKTDDTKIDVELSEKIFEKMAKYNIKPYLVPLIDMTDEQREEASKIFGMNYEVSEFGDIQSSKLIDDDIAYIDIERVTAYTDWLNKNSFDYRGLISKGLAINKAYMKQ